MRKLAQTLLIALGCFSAAGVYASDPNEEVVVTTEEDTSSTQHHVFQQADDEQKPKN